MENLKVLTLNTWMREGPYESRKPLIQQWIKRLEPDLIGFQEVEEHQTEELLDGLGFHIAWRNGLSIASRWDLSDVETFDLPHFNDNLDTGGPVLACTVDSPAGLIPFVNGTTYYFLPKDGWQRESQMPALNQFLISRRIKGGYPVVLVGDFNAVPEANEHRYMRGLCAIDGTSTFYIDAWDVLDQETGGATWAERNDYAAAFGLPDRRIDYIYVASAGRKGPGSVLSCEVVCDEAVDGVWPSDHFGVFARLSLN